MINKSTMGNLKFNIFLLYVLVQYQELCGATATGSETNEEEPAVSSIFNKKQNNKNRKNVNRRKKNEENWIRSICKRKRNFGEEFVNRAGRFVPKRYLKPSCGANCLRKCREAVTENERHVLFKKFWGLGDHHKQTEYLIRLVKRVPKKCSLVRADSTRRKWSYEYYMFVGGKKIRTCKTMFLNTFCISDTWLQTYFRKRDLSAAGSR